METHGALRVGAYIIGWRSDMGKPELINFMAETVYNEICDRAWKMVVKETGLNFNEKQRVWIEAGIAAGVTTAIKTFGEAGLFK